VVTTDSTIDGLIARMQALLDSMDPGDVRSYFLATYLRTTRAVRSDLAGGGFVDPEWAERWDVAFADRYLDAVEQWDAARTAPGPWSVAFEAARGGPRLPPVRHVLLGMNAHINFYLPQALLAVVTDGEFDDPAVLARREADHARIDEILASRVRAEDVELRKVEQPGRPTSGSSGAAVVLPAPQPRVVVADEQAHGRFMANPTIILMISRNFEQILDGWRARGTDQNQAKQLLPAELGARCRSTEGAGWPGGRGGGRRLIEVRADGAGEGNRTLTVSLGS
jgi:hypothetical protein